MNRTSSARSSARRPADALTWIAPNARRLEGRRAFGRSDAGQVTFLMLVPIIAGLVAFTLLLMVGLGDGTRSRTQTRTAADSAALAAATEWNDALRTKYEQVIDQQPGWQLALLQLLAPGAPATLAGTSLPAAQAAAQEFAAKNDAVVTSFQFVPSAGGIQYRVTTRSSDPAKISNTYTTGTAVASVRLRDGLCYVDAASRLGIVIAGTCVDPWGATPPIVLPPALPPTLPNPLNPVALDGVAELDQ